MSLPYLQPYLGLSNGLNTLHAAGGPGGAVGGWVELGRSTLGSSATDITVSSLADKRYYMLLHYSTGFNTNANTHLRFNGDTGSNYSARGSFNGGADSTDVSQNRILTGGNSTATPNFDVTYIANYASKEKLVIAHNIRQRAAGATVAPERNESVGKWANTSSAINSITNSTIANTHNSGSELVVLGYDPLDSHTNNFWEELASVSGTGSSTNLSSGTITAKKYLWVQIYQQGTSADLSINFNNDTSSIYCDRYNINNAEGSRTNQTKFQNWLHQGYGGQSSFINMFILNNSSDDKLVIAHSVSRGAGSDATTIPRRGEWVGKWVNSNQITEIETDSQTSNFGANSFIKVWGSD
jgi:hypothetical protein